MFLRVCLLALWAGCTIAASVDSAEAGGTVVDLGDGVAAAPVPSNDEDSNKTALQAAKAAKAAQAAAFSKSVQGQEKRQILLKPPGCRPGTTAQLLDYDNMRTKCAKTKPAPSAFTTPPTQTPIEVKLTNIKIVALMDKQKQFTMEMTRSFRWRDQDSQTMHASMLWNPKMAFSFPNSVKVQSVAPMTVNREGVQLVLTEQVRVTFLNNWDYSHFPFDRRVLVAQMASASLSSTLEPLTLKMDPVRLPSKLFGFSPTSALTGSIVMGQPLGPHGVWGKSQMIELQAPISRLPSHDIVKILLPITLCIAVSYGGFFLKIGQLMPRLVSAIICLLVLFFCMSLVSAALPDGSDLVWAEHWLTIQTILVVIGCCHHSLCHYLNERYGETKYVHLDMSMRICYPIAFVLSFFWAESIIAWKTSGYFFLSGTALATVLLFGGIFMALERRSAARYEEKTYYPGI